MHSTVCYAPFISAVMFICGQVRINLCAEAGVLFIKLSQLTPLS